MSVPFEPFGQLPRQRKREKAGRKRQGNRKTELIDITAPCPHKLMKDDESVHMENFVPEPFFIVELVVVYVTGNKGTVLYNNRNLGTPKVRPELILQSVERETHGRDSSGLLLNH